MFGIFKKLFGSEEIKKQEVKIAPKKSTLINRTDPADKISNEISRESNYKEYNKIPFYVENYKKKYKMGKDGENGREHNADYINSSGKVVFNIYYKTAVDEPAIITFFNQNLKKEELKSIIEYAHIEGWDKVEIKTDNTKILEACADFAQIFDIILTTKNKEMQKIINKDKEEEESKEKRENINKMSKI